MDCYDFLIACSKINNFPNILNRSILRQNACNKINNESRRGQGMPANI